MRREILSSELISVATVVVVLVLAASAFAARDERTLYSFSGGNDGSGPQGTLVADTAGNLYGTTYYGGGSNQCGGGCGTVFELTPQSDGHWTESVLYQFSNGATGAFPNGGLVFDSSGNLYGSTQTGGIDYGGGVVFELSPSSDGWSATTLYAFTGGSDGGQPYIPPIIDANGTLYGTTRYGGGSGDGVVFELKKSNDSWTESVLYSFTGGRDGSFPEGLAMDPSGNLYGAALGGGTANRGVLFELKFLNGNWKELTLHSFSGGYNGGGPSGNPVFDKGELFGSTSYGGGGGCNQGCGIVFKLALNSRGKWTETVLHLFKDNGHDGTLPLLWFNHGPNLYGITNGGGSFAVGTIFELLPAFDGSWVEKVLYDFTGGSDGGVPSGLMLNSGKLFGTAQEGGENYDGVVFELTP
jgi:uncharacterized repeat protein (TIGR03803 family)